jgi:hypothetical protein
LRRAHGLVIILAVTRQCRARKSAKPRAAFEKTARSYPNPSDVESERELMAPADAQIAAKA